jgi:hypothetical protein
MARIYISHSPLDETFARDIADSLDNIGADLWLEVNRLPNERWHNDLDNGFQICDAMVVILSAAAASEGKVVADWNRYFERGKPVVLVAIQDPDTFGIKLEAGQYVDFHSQSYPAGIRQLIETLRFHGVVAASVSPPPVVVSAAAQAAQSPQPAPARRQVSLPNLGLRRGANQQTQPTLAQETALTPGAPRPRRNLTVPIAIGVVLALLACGALVALVVLPEINRVNAEATAFANETQVAISNQTRAALDAIETATGVAFQATAEVLRGTQVALAATEQANNQAVDLVAATATAAAQMATVQALGDMVFATQTAQAFMMDAAALGALQGTLSAQQAADRGLPPATPPTTHEFANQSLLFSLQTERFIGMYAVREWADPTFTYHVLTIDQAGQPRIQIDSFIGGNLLELTGNDVTGEGNPDVIYERAFGGATGLACSVFVYDLGTRAAQVVETPTGSCGAYFADLNADGTRELLMNDTTFAYQFCSGAESPLVEVVLAFDRRGRRYAPQSANFPEHYRSLAQAFLARVDLPAQLSAQAAAGQMESVKCGVLGVVLPYLYGGMRDTAWSEFRRLYPYADAAAFRAQIERLFNESPFCK